MKTLAEWKNIVDKESVMEAISWNEIGKDRDDLIAHFSDAKLGNSGYSYGRSQFDTRTNKQAREQLRSAGFTEEEIQRLILKKRDIDDLQKKISTKRIFIDTWDIQHIKKSIEHVGGLPGVNAKMNMESFYHLVDYHNQLNLEIDGQMHNWLKKQQELTPNMILDFKFAIKWGRKAPKDVERRFKNIRLFFKNMVE